MSNTHLYAPLAFAIGIILLIFAIRPLYATYIENVDTIGSISAQQDILDKKLSTLSDIQTQLQKK
jgi:cytochrome c oxidase assembly protein Cox11